MKPENRLPTIALLLFPGALTAYLSFNAGGFFANTVAFVAIVTAVVFILRVGVAQAPFEGVSRLVLVAGGALVLFAGWTFLSAVWSDATSRALIEADRALLYALILLLFASLGRTEERLRWLVRGVAVAILVVGTIALITRVLPNVWPTSADVANNRLSYPLTYWNALGLLVGLGIVFGTYLTTSLREPRVVRVLAAAAIPLLATTLLFTFSRGAIAATIVGVVAYVLLARPHGLLTGLAAVAPPTAVALIVAYNADLLATTAPTTPAAVDQGHHVAAVVGACVAAAGLLRALTLLVDPRLARLHLPRVRWQALVGGGLLVLIPVVGVALALHAPGTIKHEYHDFAHGKGVGKPSDFRARLTDPGNNGRIDQWDVAIDAFERKKLDGTGAGTYALEWAQHRPNASFVLDTHSLYAEVLGELGIVGFVLLMVGLGAILVGVATRMRGGHRSVYAALFAAALAWLVHAGVDWDWEMPAVTVWLFAAGGLAMARPAGEGRAHAWAPLGARIAAMAALAAVAVVPSLVFVSQTRLDDSLDHFSAKDCPAAIDSAQSSSSVLGSRPEPYEVIGFCELYLRNPPAGVAAMTKALRRDPHNWQYHQDLAIARAAAGEDPRPEARKALRLNPLQATVIDTAQRLSGHRRARWKRQAKVLTNAAFE